MLFTAKYRRKAVSLLRLCQSLVVSSFEDLAPHSPLIASMQTQAQLEKWDMFMMIAATGTALELIETTTAKRQFKGFHSVLIDQLETWHPTGPQMLEHLMVFSFKHRENGLDRPAAIGAWVISNIKGDAPTDEELQVSPIIGDYLADTLQNWWNRLG